MYLKSIQITSTSVALTAAPEEPTELNELNRPNEPEEPKNPRGRGQIFVLSPREWEAFNRALGYDPAAGLTLPEGSPLDERMFTLLEEAAERTAALRYAARVLSAADSSEGALRRKLSAKGFSPAAADDTVRRLRSRGYLDDRTAAARYAGSLLASKRYGRRRILEMLLARGFDRDTAREALDALSPDELADALDFLIRRRCPGVLSPDPAARKKAAAALMRLGYSTDEIREAVRRARDEET